LVKILPRLASCTPLRCLILAHFEWPAMWNPVMLFRHQPPAAVRSV
jgi:hypothetical protein